MHSNRWTRRGRPAVLLSDTPDGVKTRLTIGLKCLAVTSKLHPTREHRKHRKAGSVRQAADDQQRAVESILRGSIQMAEYPADTVATQDGHFIRPDLGGNS